jgi:competence protein ComEA
LLLKTFIKDYLTFTRKEKIGLLCLIIILAIVIFSPSIFFPKHKNPVLNSDKEWMNAIKTLSVTTADSNSKTDFENNPTNYQYESSSPSDVATHAELFYFNPNTLSTDGWKRLGLKEKTIKTIENYLRKGGHFKKPEDLQRIYGLQKNEYERLLPFIRIPELENQKYAASNTSKPFVKSNYSSAVKNNYNSIIDANTSDTTAFINLPGIGSKLAARIVNFREKLGGFYSVEQVGETYGVPDSTFQKIKTHLQILNPEIKKININTASKDELKIHPYIKWSLANAIVEYRTQHGDFKSLSDLKKISIITDDVFEKIMNYLRVE